MESTEFAGLTCIKSRIILPSNELEKPDVGRDISEKALEYFSNIPWIADRNDLQIDTLAEKVSFSSYVKRPKAGVVLMTLTGKKLVVFLSIAVLAKQMLCLLWLWRRRWKKQKMLLF